MARWVGLELVVLGDSILWSLIAEEIYYVLYPLLRLLNRRYSWPFMAGMAYLAALGMASTQPQAMNYPSFGIYGNWILGLPCWLLGCQLAHSIDGWGNSAASISFQRIWTLRILAVGVGTLCSIARFHLGIGYPWSLTLCSPLIYFWLQNEILYHRDRAPYRLLESAGMMTYSIYLTHLLAAKLLTEVWAPISEQLVPRTLFFCSLLAITAVFYVTIELPSHQLARWSAKWIQSRAKKGKLQTAC